MTLPIVDLTSLGEDDGVSLTRIAAAVGAAWRDIGFFYVVNHGVEAALLPKRSLSPVAFLVCRSPTSGGSRSRRLGATAAILGSFTSRSTRREDRT
jgi:hypothetical protein